MAYLAVAIAGLIACQRADDREDRAAFAPRPTVAPRRLGTPHPITVEKIGPDGRWVVACQARADTNGDGQIAVLAGAGDPPRSDALVPYLFRHGVGEGERIDAFVDASRDGRWVVVIRDGILIIIDLATGADQPLPDASVEAVNFYYDGLARIDDAQQTLIYLRKADPHEVAIYDLRRHDVRTARAARPIVAVVPERDAPWVAVMLDPPPVRVRRFARRFSPKAAHEATCEGGDYVPPDPRQLPIEAWLSLETGALSPPSAFTHVPGEPRPAAPPRQVLTGPPPPRYPLERDYLPSGPLTWVDPTP